MHQEVDLTGKHEVFILVDDHAVAHGKVSYTQIMLLELTGFIRKENEFTWRVLAESSETEH